jgi:ElaB/YqjD/DUF883 family membrane-anchored ribosome-binding protein
MLDLKPYFDAVNTANAEVQRIAAEIDVLFREGSEESKVKALALRPALDEAQKKLAEAESFYESMQTATRPNDIAKNFVPIADPDPEAEGSQPTVIKRQDYDQMSLVDRAKFVKSGGTVTDK